MITVVTWSPFIGDNIPDEGLTFNFSTMDEVYNFVKEKFPADNEFYPFARIKQPGFNSRFFDACHYTPGLCNREVALSTEDDLESEN